MLYLLDANVLIDANRDYYPQSRVPEYWEWLTYRGTQGRVKIPVEILEELRAGHDELAVWSRQAAVEQALLFDEEADTEIVRRVVSSGYAPDLSDVELEKLGQDPFLIAYAFADPRGRCVVSTESSRPRMKRSNRHIPDVCDDLGVLHRDAFELVRDLDFRTSWTPDS